MFPIVPLPQDTARTGTRSLTGTAGREGSAGSPQTGGWPLGHEGGTHQPPSKALAANGAAHVLHAARDVENQLPQPLLAFQALTGNLAVSVKRTTHLSHPL